MAVRRSLGVVGNPENRRIGLFLDAVRRAGLEEPEVRSWTEVIDGGTFPKVMLCRIESPGEHWPVRRSLLRLGGADPSDISAASVPGRVIGSKAFFDGFIQLVKSRENRQRLSTSSDDLAALFDKHRTRDRLDRAGVPTPDFVGTIRSFDELVEKMRAGRIPRVFVKLRHASSASGVLAYETNGTRHQLMAAAELKQGPPTQVFNSLRVRRYRAMSEIRSLINAIATDGMVAERWVPKAGLDGRCFDLRVVVVAGKSRHVVVRTARSPFTNLNLGNRRGDLDAVRRRLGSQSWHEAMTICEQAASCFPSTTCVGVDLLVGLDGLFRVAEVNAFGDLLPGIEDRGQDTYDAQVEAYRTLIAKPQVSTTGR